MRRPLTLIVALLSACVLAALASAQTTEVAGTWDTTLVSPQATFNFKIILKREGDKLSGVLKSERGELPLQGTITGKEVKINYTVKFQDNDLPITLTGQLEGAEIKGKADFGGFAEGDWSAKRATDEAATAAKPAAGAPDAGGKVDVSGAWIFEVETSMGAGSPAFTFKQDGENLTGQYKGAFGEAPLTGTVKGNEIKFSFKVTYEGQTGTVTYTGTIDKDSMKGNSQLGELGTATWTAKRQK